MIKMSRRTNEKQLIIREWNWIYENLNKFDLISHVKQPIINPATIGQKVDHIKAKNFINLHTKIFEEESFSICLSDDSLICFYYIYDKQNEIVGHNLMYLPFPIDEDNGTGEETARAKYIRVDYDQEGHEDVVHTKVHLHVGVYKTNFRIPVSHYLTPKDFLYLILKYVYHSKDKFIDKLIVNKERKNLLTEMESDKFRLLLGE